ncbi:MAG: leucine-rich repeat protein, partial [Clostridia bacterium]|nr:leucine-rich repeat protein [Clostridia bacterium]
MQVGYISDNLDYDPNDPNDSAYILNPFNSYLTPVYSERNSTSYVTYELTDYIYEIKEKATTKTLDGYDFKNSIAISCYDYALNESTFQIPLPDDITEFYFTESELVLSENEVFTLEPKSYPGTEWSEFLVYNVWDNDVVNVVGNKLVAVGKGETTVAVQNPTTGDYVYLDVRVLGEGDPGYQYYDKPVAEEFTLVSYETLKAYYNVSTDERDIGTTGSITTFNGRQSLKMFPSESVGINYRLMAYFPNDTEIRVESSNTDIVEIEIVDGKVIVTAKAEGYGSVTLSVYLDGQMTYYSETVDIEVKDPYITSGPSLKHYFGLGGVVTFPDRLDLTDIAAFAFSNYDWVAKGENDEISEEEPAETKQWFIGEDTITKVIIPEGVKTIGAYAFANLTALEEIVLPSTIQSIEYGAFYNCVSLTKVTGIENVQLINKAAFYNCPIEGKLDLSGAYAVSDNAFAINTSDTDLLTTISAKFVDSKGNSTHPKMTVIKKDGKITGYRWNLAGITEVTLPDTLKSIGAYTFTNQYKLEKVSVAADSVKLGQYVFSGCLALKDIDINSQVIPSGAFFGCYSLTNFKIGPSVAVIGEYAFHQTSIESFTVDKDNKTFAAQADGAYLISADGTTLLMVAPKTSSTFELLGSSVYKIGDAAFSGNLFVTSAIIPTVTEVGEYAFADCEKLTSVSLGVLDVIGDWAFANTAISAVPVFSPNLKKIGAYSFAYSNITEVYIPEGMEIGEAAFAECVKLATVVIADNVVIGASAFMTDPYCQIHQHLDTNYNVNDYSYIDMDTGVRVYYFNFKSALTTLTIGDNVKIGDGAFYYASDLVEVTLGSGAYIGNSAFYNAQSLTTVHGLSEAIYIGDFAFSGDSFVVYADASLADGTEYIKNNSYILKYFSAPLTSVDISSATYVGERAFHYCDQLTTVVLNPELSSIGTYAFANCDKLTSINIENVKYIGECAFAETGLVSVDISGAKTVGEYAFAYCPALVEITFGKSCELVAEGAFASSKKLATVNNLNYVSNIESYAFAYTAITNIDLSGAISLGDQVFIKENFTNIDLKLGNVLNKIGDNPFAMCIIDLEDMKRTVKTDTFNGRPIYSETYSYDISENVRIIDGSIYAVVPAGLELITYIGDAARVKVADGTVRISSYAFAGSSVADVTFPYTLEAIGHKAFYGCTNLSSVTFASYKAPILEEEYDAEYFESYDHIPTIGEFKYSYILYNGKTETRIIKGLGFIPYYAWGAAARPSNVFYGANFKDYIGHVDGNIAMIRPVNGTGYDTFVYAQYFDYVKDGAQAADDVTLNAVNAIQKLAAINRINLTHEELVKAAREAYNKIATAEQRALISTWLTDDGSQSLEAVLTSAERRIEALKSAQNMIVPEDDLDEAVEEDNYVWVWITVSVMLVGGVLAVVVIREKDKKKAGKTEDEDEEEW